MARRARFNQYLQQGADASQIDEGDLQYLLQKAYELRRRRSYERAMRAAGRPIAVYDPDEVLERKLRLTKEMMDYQNDIRDDVGDALDKRLDFLGNMYDKIIQYAIKDLETSRQSADEKVKAKAGLFQAATQFQQLNEMRKQMNLTPSQASAADNLINGLAGLTEVSIAAGGKASSKVSANEALSRGIIDADFYNEITNNGQNTALELEYADIVNRTMAKIPEGKRHLFYDRLQQTSKNATDAQGNPRNDLAVMIEQSIYQKSPDGQISVAGQMIDADRANTKSLQEKTLETVGEFQQNLAQELDQLYGTGGVGHLKRYMAAFGLTAEDGSFDISPEAMEAAVQHIPRDPNTGELLPMVVLQAELAKLADSEDPSSMARMQRLMRDERFLNYMKDTNAPNPKIAVKRLMKDLRTRDRKARRAYRRGEKVRSMGGQAEEPLPHTIDVFFEDEAFEAQEAEQQMPASNAAMATQGSGGQDVEAPSRVTIPAPAQAPTGTTPAAPAVAPAALSPTQQIEKELDEYQQQRAKHAQFYRQGAMGRLPEPTSGVPYGIAAPTGQATYERALSGVERPASRPSALLDEQLYEKRKTKSKSKLK